MQMLQQLVAEIVLTGSTHTHCRQVLQPASCEFLCALGVFRGQGLPPEERVRRLQNRVIFDHLLDPNPPVDDWICFAADISGDDDREWTDLLGVDNEAFMALVWYNEWFALWWSRRQADVAILERAAACDFVRAFRAAHPASETALHALLRERHMMQCVAAGRGDRLLACIARVTRQSESALAADVIRQATDNQLLWQARLRREKAGRSWADFVAQHGRGHHGAYVDVLSDCLGRGIFVMGAAPAPVSGTLHVPCFSNAAITAEPLLLVYHAVSRTFHHILPCPFRVSPTKT